jgi:hypothetical protein
VGGRTASSGGRATTIGVKPFARANRRRLPSYFIPVAFHTVVR